MKGSSSRCDRIVFPFMDIVKPVAFISALIIVSSEKMPALRALRAGLWNRDSDLSA
jgi:hypothetical protein